MSQYQYSIGSTPQTVTGVLTWNANGTLGSLQITDQLNSANTQTCTYGYDDLVRIGSVSCTNTPTNIWGQTFGYDPFGNLSKSLVTGFPGTSFQPTYNTATNRISSSPFTYDANGNTTHDNVRSYTWDAEGKALTADTISLTYDALGRMVEQSGATQIVYAPTGQKFALMNGQTVAKAFVALPGGAQAVYVGTTLTYYRHGDWLGSSRLTTTQSRTVYSSLAYAPFGETYAESGTPDRSFTGQNQDTIPGSTTGLYDFLYREYAQFGRWISPDPAGLSAVSLATPQSWNRYVYVFNVPLVYVDPLGLRERFEMFGCIWEASGPSDDETWEFLGCVPRGDGGEPSHPPIIEDWGHTETTQQPPMKKCVPRSTLPLSTRLTLDAMSIAAKATGVSYFIGAQGSLTVSKKVGFSVGGSAIGVADPQGNQAFVVSLGASATVGTPGWSAGIQVGAATYQSYRGFEGGSFGWEISGGRGLNVGFGKGSNSSGVATYANIGFAAGKNFDLSPSTGSYGLFIVPVCKE